ncbi:chemotaxis protein CheW [Treponema sp.]|uniref:chemotaxis protein CheW n=1 Tax=Treponema sp. TaxID=166 RepID=UPI00388FF675
MITNYLTFTVDDSTYALDVDSVLEVLNFSNPTAVPCALPYIEGLIYSREQGITIVNFRKRFGLTEHEIDKRTKIIVVEVPSPKEDDENHITLYGLVADSVQDVVQIFEEEPVKDLSSPIPAEFISSVLKYNESAMFVLNPSMLFKEAGELNLGEKISKE